MSVQLLVQIDGKTIPLATCDWVLYGPCGCPFGVTVGWAAPGEEAAWKAFYERKRDRDKAQRDGYRIELITHAQWSAEVMPLMTARCKHDGGAA